MMGLFVIGLRTRLRDAARRSLTANPPTRGQALTKYVMPRWATWHLGNCDETIDLKSSIITGSMLVKAGVPPDRPPSPMKYPSNRARSGSMDSLPKIG